jgi:hypothetical protein
VEERALRAPSKQLLSRLIEKLRPYLLSVVNQHADHDLRGFFFVEDIVRLETKAAIAFRQFVDGLTDAWKVRKKAKCAL